MQDSLEIPAHLNQMLDPYELVDPLREASPVCRVRNAEGLDAWMITRHADVVRVLTDARFSVDSRNAAVTARQTIEATHSRTVESFADSILATDPPEHTWIRKAVARGLTPNRLRELRVFITETIEQLLARLDGATQFDLVADFASPLSLQVSAHLMGVPTDDLPQLARWSYDLMLMPKDQSARTTADAGMAQLEDYFRALIERHSPHANHDLLATLIAARDAGEITPAQLLATAKFVFVAAHDTTGALISATMFHVLRQNGALNSLVSDPRLISNAIEECLRFDTPVPLPVTFFATENVTLGGVTIAAGDQVFAAIGAANRDPRVVETPAEFHIQREHPAHLSFGLGIHYCLGAQLARLEASAALEALIEHHPHLRLAVPAHKVPWRPTVTRVLHALPVVSSPPYE
ncbi:cytochrome P450 [Agromyces sp. NPDC058126]|uniref:cytochrome P450 n=1 Tax=Agromyces sp. NPDC058126 TaxID=3346350 RepID=UPI0036D85066